MKTNVSKDSLIAYWKLRDSGELPEKERQVYEAVVRHGPMTREQIAAVTGMKEGSACGRVAGLMEKGMLEHHSSIENPVTGNPNEVVWLTPHRAQMRQCELDLVAA